MSGNSVASSLLYKFAERLLVKGLGLIISIILARLLSPTEFGQIALIMVFINLSVVLIDSGLNTALVQNKHTTIEDYSTVFYISFSIAALLVVLLWIASPFIGDYYEDEAIVLPLRVYSFTLLIGAANSVLVAKMQREMRFGKMMVCNLVACIVAGTVGVAMAYGGFGIWALVAYYFTSTLVTCVALLVATKWYPLWVFSVGRARELFGYGWKMLLSGIMCGLYNDLRALIIGKVYGPADLGYYNRGQQFPEVISNTLDNALQSVMFPVMAAEQDSAERVRTVLSRTLLMGSLIIMPLMFALAVVAAPFIEFLLTDKWLPSVVYMQWLCVGFASIPMVSSCLVAIKALGRSDVYMRLEFVRRIVMLAVLLVSVFCFDSVLAIAVGFAVSSWLDVVVISFPMKRLFGYGLGRQIADVWRVVAAVVAMSGAMVVVGQLLELAPFWQMCCQLIVGVMVYLLACMLLKVEALRGVVAMIRKR